MLHVGATGKKAKEEENSYVLTMCGYAIASYIVCSIIFITVPEAKRTAKKPEFSKSAAANTHNLGVKRVTQRVLPSQVMMEA
jgi:hypothetical protein